MAETINMPKLGFDMAEGTLVRWVKKEGEPVNKGEILAEIETDKATVEVESSASGVVRKLVVEEGAVVPVGAPIAIVGTAEERIDEGAQGLGKPEAREKVKGRESKVEGRPSEMPQSTTADQRSSIVKASPLAKRLAREQRVDLSKLTGTGPGGRIVRRDIELALAGGSAITDHGRPTAVTAPSSVVHRPSPLSDETLPLSKLRQAIARRMTESKTSVPHFYVTHEYNMDSLLDLRRQYNAMQPEDGKASINDFIVKAAALALTQFPNLNASFAGSQVVRHGAVSIGVAVSVEGGLLTVVCRDADRKTLGQIAAELKAMAARARQGKVRPDDIEGSTFSISNMGMFDVENFAAIINPPEAAILAVGSARQVPVAVGANGRPPEIRVAWRMKATISVDHRVSDGVEAAKFMQALAAYIEEPLRLLL
jgi:pyruvate dehydrogenase E2 component (dihydrolipoamide acetyltransferase)